MTYLNVYKVERCVNDSTGRIYFKVKSDILRTYYTRKTKKEAIQLAHELNARFNKQTGE